MILQEGKFRWPKRMETRFARSNLALIPDEDKQKKKKKKVSQWRKLYLEGFFKVGEAVCLMLVVKWVVVILMEVRPFF